MAELKPVADGRSQFDGMMLRFVLRSETETYATARGVTIGCVRNCTHNSRVIAANDTAILYSDYGRDGNLPDDGSAEGAGGTF